MTMRRLAMATIAATLFGTALFGAALLGSGSASAQSGASSPPALGATSPLGIGPTSPVAPTGLPLGAIELATPGVSPMTSGASPLAPAAGSTTTCSGIGASSAGTSSSSAIFDGGGMTGTVSGTCAAIDSSSIVPAASASSPGGMGSAQSVGRVGIPLGSTELGAGGLSPPPDLSIANPSAPVSTQGSIAPCVAPGTAVAGMSSGTC